MEKYPDLYNFPYLVIFSTIAVTYFISWTSIIVLFVFLLTYIIVYFMVNDVSHHRIRSEYFGSERSRLIVEVLLKIRSIKEENLENYFQEKIHKVRHKDSYVKEKNMNSEGALEFKAWSCFPEGKQTMDLFSSPPLENIFFFLT